MNASSTCRCDGKWGSISCLTKRRDKFLRFKLGISSEPMQAEISDHSGMGRSRCPATSV